MGEDPAGYLRFVRERLQAGRYDVFIPVHEQAYLFSKFTDELRSLTGVALAPFASFERLQGKAAFAELLEELELRGPRTRAVGSAAELAAEQAFPYFIKTEFGNASAGVWSVRDAFDLRQALREIDEAKIFVSGQRLLVQQACTGQLEAVQAAYCEGRLVAYHTFRRVLEGARGGSAVKESTSRPQLLPALEKLGAKLAWHGSLHLEFFWDFRTNEPVFIDANPRLVEPVNALVAGLDLVDIHLRLSLGEKIEGAVMTSQAGVRTHAFVGSFVGLAARGAPRWRLVREASRMLMRRGEYSGSRESLTPVGVDRRALVPALFASLRMLRKPSFAREVGQRTVMRYSLSPEAIGFVRKLPSLASLAPEAVADA
jgi:predicted ATP-grasp superfamily ATP-dependent carboligase